MANLLYRISLTPTEHTATTVKGSALTNLEIDANWFAVNKELGEKATIEDPYFTGTATFNSDSGLTIPVGDSDSRPNSATDGMIRYNNELKQYEGYSNGVWGSLGGGATGADGDQVFYLNDQVVHHSFTIPEGKNAHTTGPISLDDGVVITVSDGSRLVVL